MDISKARAFGRRPYPLVYLFPKPQSVITFLWCLRRRCCSFSIDSGRGFLPQTESWRVLVHSRDSRVPSSSFAYWKLLVEWSTSEIETCRSCFFKHSISFVWASSFSSLASFSSFTTFCNQTAAPPDPSEHQDSSHKGTTKYMNIRTGDKWFAWHYSEASGY